MNRSTFLSQLRVGLIGLPHPDVDDILKDYESHFADGAAEGRSEEDVAAALGDPVRLAKELRAEFGLKRLEKKGSALNIAGALLALGGLATLDMFVLLPLSVLAGVIMLIIVLVLIIVGLVGAAEFLSVPWDTFDSVSDFVARILEAAGLIAAAISGAAFLLVGLDAGARTLGRYARVHYRLLQHADPNGGPP